MVEVTRKQNIFFQWLLWHFFEAPKEILKAWRNFLLFSLNYFSLHLLLKTLFSHWRNYKWNYPKGFEPGKYLEVFFSNLISRILGAMVRTILLIAGFLFEVFIVFAGFSVFFFWILLPAILIWGLIFSIKIVF